MQRSNEADKDFHIFPFTLVVRTVYACLIHQKVISLTWTRTIGALRIIKCFREILTFRQLAAATSKEIISGNGSGG